MIIPISEKSKSLFSSSNLTLGLRIPNSMMAKFLINESGPLLTSSANISGLTPATSAKDISMDLPNVDILGPVPWEKCSGKASTIISWVNHGKWKIIRRRTSLNSWNRVMLFLFFFIFLIQFFSYWIFEPLTSFLTNLLELRFLPIFFLLIFIFLFSTKKRVIKFRTL